MSGHRTPSAQSSDDPFDLSASATASGADPLGVDPVAEAPFSAVSISSGPTGKSTSSRTARRGRGKKNQSQKLMLQCGIGFGVFLVLAASILLWPRDDNTDSLKQLVYKQFYDCEDEKLLKKLIEKHHRHCVDACTNPDEKTVDGKKYEKMMRKRVAKDLRAEGLRY